MHRSKSFFASVLDVMAPLCVAIYIVLLVTNSKMRAGHATPTFRDTLSARVVVFTVPLVVFFGFWCIRMWGKRFPDANTKLNVYAKAHPYMLTLKLIVIVIVLSEIFRRIVATF
jgi:hypothetical protein